MFSVVFLMQVAISGAVIMFSLGKRTVQMANDVTKQTKNKKHQNRREATNINYLNEIS